MRLVFEFEPDKKETNIGIAKALIERIQSVSDLREIYRYLEVYCDERVFDVLPNEALCGPAIER